MKKLFFVVMLIGLCSCTKVFNPYHSTASLPYYSKTTKSTLTYVEHTEEKVEDYEYGVFSCIDSIDVKYLIVAPKAASTGVINNPYDYYSMAHSVCLMPTEARELFRVVRNTLTIWDEDVDQNDAEYYEYMLAPESEIKKVSENVSKWNPTIKYWYQHNSSGSMSYLLIGEGINRYSIKLHKKEKVEELVHVLEEGILMLEKM